MLSKSSVVEGACITVRFSMFMLLITVTLGCWMPAPFTLTVKICSPFCRRRSRMAPAFRFCEEGVVPVN